jgi:hypothetical protein
MGKMRNVHKIVSENLKREREQWVWADFFWFRMGLEAVFCEHLS